MEASRLKKILAALMMICSVQLSGAVPAFAQITTGQVTGSVRDSQNAVIPGATVTLVSSTRGTPTSITSTAAGDFVFPNVQADTYLVRVTLDGFKTLERPGVIVAPGDRVVVGALTLELGLLNETVTVAGEAPMIQSQSGERSYSISAEAVQNIAINGRSYQDLIALAPGYAGGTFSGQRTNQRNIQVDGITAIETGSNSASMVPLSADAVQEVRVVTTGYQAEYGLHSGAQISAVTKSGGQEFQGSLYAYSRNSRLNSNTWINKRDGIAKPQFDQKDFGFNLGGPVPGMHNVFFFVNQEYQRRFNNGTVSRVRVPTELERRGDFSQTVDNSGNLFPYIRDYTTALPCGASDTRGCFQDGGVVGRITQSRLYDMGVGILNMYPAPNSPGTIGQGFNYTNQGPLRAPNRQDLIRLDYQVASNLRVYGKFLQNKSRTENERSLPGLTDVVNHCACKSSLSFSGTMTLNATTFLEATWGRSTNQSVPFPAFAEHTTKTALGFAAIPSLYPNPRIPKGWAGRMMQRYYPPSEKGFVDLPPTFTYGGRVANSPTLEFRSDDPFLWRTTTRDASASITKLMSRHTAKTGFYWHHGLKEQTSFGSPYGNISFQNDASNPFDSGFPFANTLLGVYQSYTQSSGYNQGIYVYNNVEWYLQDNWKATNKLTLDYGVRFYWIEPQYETTGLAANFLPEKWDSRQAPRLYYPGRNAGGQRVAVDPVTGETLAAVYIGRIVPNSGNLLDGLFTPGNGIDRKLYKDNGILYTPRLGFAYDVTGRQRFVIRGAAGQFFDRLQGNTVFDLISNPPSNIQPTLLNGRLQDLGTGGVALAPPQLFGFAYDGKVPRVYNYNVGVQLALPWTIALDVSYVGSYSTHSIQRRNINAPDYGAAFNPENQDPTLPASSVPGATSLPVDFLRPFRGYGNIGIIEPVVNSRYDSLQASLNRRYRNGLSFGVNYTLGRAFGVSDADRAGFATLGSPRNDGKDKQANYGPLGLDRRHAAVANFVWDLPDASMGRLVNSVINDWQLAGVYELTSGAPYTVTFLIPGISTQNLTGAVGLDGARVMITGDTGSGHSDDPYSQFNVGAFTTPKPGSIGLESGINYMKGAPTNELDLSLSRSIRVGASRRLELRVDAFNVMNTVRFTDRNSQLVVRGLTDPTPTNLAKDASGNVVNLRGFGAVTAVAPAREIQLMARFQF